jgi:hypothetical protein
MSREALLTRETFVEGAKPLAQAVEKPRFPGPRQMDLPIGLHLAYGGALLTFMGAVASVAIGSPAMGIVFAICLVCFGSYFGGMLLLNAVKTGEPKQRQAFRSEGIVTGSGELTAGQAAAQVLTLPFLVAGFGIFAAIAARFIF